MISALLGSIVAFVAGQAIAVPTAVEIEKAVAAVAGYDFGESRAPLWAIDKVINDTHGSDALRAVVEREMVKLLESGAKFAAKQEICRRLWIVGTDASVPALTQMLANPDARVVEAACFALSRHPSPAVGKALREAIGQARGTGLVAVIRLLGDRRDAQCVDALVTIAAGSDAAASGAAIVAMGQIATPPAAEALTTLHAGDRPERRAVASHALLQAGQELAARGKADEARALFAQLAAESEPPHVCRGALLGRVRLGGPEAVALVLAVLNGKDEALKAAAIASIPAMRGEKIGSLFAERIAQLPPAQQELLIAALADRGDRAALPAIARAAEHADPRVRIAAIKALGALGDASCVPLLVKACQGDVEQSSAAEASLRLIKGDGVEAAIIGAAKAAEPGLRVSLIRVLTDRRCADASSFLLAEAGSDQAGVRQAAWEALGKVGGERDLLAAIRLLVELKADNARGVAERAVSQVVQQMADPSRRADPLVAALGAAQSPAARCSLLRVLGTVVDEKSYQTVAAALRSGDAQVSDTAVRVLADWPDRRAESILWDVVKNSTIEPHRVLALRGYVRLLGLDRERPAQQTARLYAEALGHARRPEEKRLVLAGLGGVAHPDALKTALACVDDTSVRSEACLATLSIARTTARLNRAAAKSALQKILSVTEDQNLRAQARAALDEIGKLKD
jgi:HEAT repeat protein